MSTDTKRGAHAPDDEFLTTGEVTKRFPFLTKGFLERGRNAGFGPKFIQRGPATNSPVYYRLSAILRWFDEREADCQVRLGSDPDPDPARA